MKLLILAAVLILVPTIQTRAAQSSRILTGQDSLQMKPNTTRWVDEILSAYPGWSCWWIR